jgi:hypothetical protein
MRDAGPDLGDPQIESTTMGLFKPDLFRSLVFGFLMGVAVMGLTAGATAFASSDSAELVAN